MLRTFQSWAHGNSVLLERVSSPSAVNKSTALAAYGGDHHSGDLLSLGSGGAAACFRIGWAARFVVIDVGGGDAPRSGFFWVHYAIPVPIHAGSFRTRAMRVLVNYGTSFIGELSVASVHVWDGNRRIFAADGVAGSGDAFDGGIPGARFAPTPEPDMSQLLQLPIMNGIPVFFGLGVSLGIRATNAHNAYLEIRGAGIECLSDDLT